MSITISLLILFSVIFAVFCENHTERVNKNVLKYTHSEGYSRWYSTKQTLLYSNHCPLRPEGDAEKEVYQTV